MSETAGTWPRSWVIAAIVGGIGVLMALEIIEEPDMTMSEILFELIEPTILVMTAAAVVHLLGRMRRQHQEQMSLIRDLQVARSEGAQAVCSQTPALGCRLQGIDRGGDGAGSF